MLKSGEIIVPTLQIKKLRFRNVNSSFLEEI